MIKAIQNVPPGRIPDVNPDTDDGTLQRAAHVVDLMDRMADGDESARVELAELGQRLRAQGYDVRV
jgi:hypothetical protein